MTTTKTDTLSKHEKNLSAIIHASTFSKYFIPFGNFILPLILWTINKKEHRFVDYNGKQALNFQISLFLYSVILGIISIPFFFSFFDWNFFDFPSLWDFNHIDINLDRDHFRFGRFFWPLGIGGLVQGALVVINVVYTILATIKTSEGQYFKYPLTIQFIK